MKGGEGKDDDDGEGGGKKKEEEEEEEVSVWQMMDARGVDGEGMYVCRCVGALV